MMKNKAQSGLKHHTLKSKGNHDTSRPTGNEPEKCYGSLIKQRRSATKLFRGKVKSII